MSNLSPDSNASAANPLSRVALSVPETAALALSYGGRIAGALLALYVAYDQTYARSQALGLSIAALTLLSLVPVPRRVATLVGALGGSIVLFGGALLWSETAGALMLFAGLAAVSGATLAAHHARRPVGDSVSALFFGSGVDAALVFAIIFLIDG